MDLKQYDDLARDWRDISVGHLTNVNYLFITLSSGFIAFCFDKDFRNDFSKIHQLLLISLVSISMLSGILLLLSRAYDFRISRHIVLLRKQYLNKYHEKIHQDGNLDSNYHFIKGIKLLLELILKDIEFLKKPSENQKNDFFIKFKSLRQKSRDLGKLTWILLKTQVLFFFISCGL